MKKPFATGQDAWEAIQENKRLLDQQIHKPFRNLTIALEGILHEIRKLQDDSERLHNKLNLLINDRNDDARIVRQHTRGES